MKRRKNRDVPDFERLYASGDREAGLQVLRDLGFGPLDAIWAVRRAEGTSIPHATEIVMGTSAYEDLAEGFWRQQDDFWALAAEAADEVERDEAGRVALTFDLRKDETAGGARRAARRLLTTVRFWRHS